MKKYIFFVIILFSVFFLLDSDTALAVTYTVSPGGSIQSAVNSAGPGDTVLVKPGSYNQDVIISKSGSVGNLIILRGEIDAQGNRAVVRKITIQGNYVRIEGFEVSGNGQGGIRMPQKTNGVEIVNNYVHHAGGDAGIYVLGSNILVQSNEIEKTTGGDGDGMRVFGNNIRIIGNYVHDLSKQYAPGCHCDGIQHYWGGENNQAPLVNVVMEDNKFINIDGQCLITETLVNVFESRDNIFRRNICLLGMKPDWQVLNIKDGDNWLVANNVLWVHPNLSVNSSDFLTSLAVKIEERAKMNNFKMVNNLIDPRIRYVYSRGETAPYNLKVDPGFVNLHTYPYDFHIADPSTSPACGAGENGADVGVYPCGSSGSTPTLTPTPIPTSTPAPTPTCTSHASYSCSSGDVYWYDSCGNREEKNTDCGNFECSGSACMTCSGSCGNSSPCASGSCDDNGQCINLSRNQSDCDCDANCRTGFCFVTGTGTDYCCNEGEAYINGACFVSTTFEMEQRVKTLTTLNVRSAPGTSATNLGTQSFSSKGTVVGGPVYANSYWWWQVDYDSGPDGWSAEDWLVDICREPIDFPCADGLFCDNFNNGYADCWEEVSMGGGTPNWRVENMAVIENSGADSGFKAPYTSNAGIYSIRTRVGVSSGSDNSVGIAFGFKDQANYYVFAWLDPLDSSNAIRAIIKSTNGNDEYLATDFGYTMTPNTWYWLSVSVSESGISAFVDNTLVLSKTFALGSQPQMGDIGLFSYGNSGVRYDDFLVTNQATPPPPDSSTPGTPGSGPSPTFVPVPSWTPSPVVVPAPTPYFPTPTPTPIPVPTWVPAPISTPPPIITPEIPSSSMTSQQREQAIRTIQNQLVYLLSELIRIYQQMNELIHSRLMY